MVPSELAFEHYEMIVRRLFTDRKEEDTLDGFKKIKDEAVNLDRRSRQKQSVKINIDAKFFEEVKNNKTHISNNPNLAGKVLLNLPKLNHTHTTARLTTTNYPSTH